MSSPLRAHSLRGQRSLPTKRHKYNNYTQCRIDWYELFTRIHAAGEGKTFKQQIEEDGRGIKLNTARTRWKQWKDAGMPAPVSAHTPPTGCADGRGSYSRHLSKEEEAALAEEVREEVRAGAAMGLTEMRAKALSLYQHNHPGHSTRSHPVPQFSTSVLIRIKKQNGLYSGKGTVKRKVSESDKTQQLSHMALWCDVACPLCSYTRCVYGAHTLGGSGHRLATGD